MGQEKANKIDKEIIRALGPFGGGIASTGKICGCVTGGVALIGSLYSKAEPGEKEDPRMWKVSYRLVSGFEKLTEKYGSPNCCDIAEVDWRNRDDVKSFYSEKNDSRRERCSLLVGETAKLLGELLDKYAE